MDGQYFAVVDRTITLLTKSDKAVDELQARKIGLLASQSGTTANAEAILAEVKKINSAINDLRELPERFQAHLRYELDSATTRVAELAERVGDTPARLAIVAVLTSPEVHKKLAAEIGRNPPGLVNEPDQTKPLELPSSPSLIGAGPSEDQ